MSFTEESTTAIEIFFCYAHEDETLRQGIVKQLKALKRQGLIDIWHDRDINAGAEWESEIDKHLKTAQIILLLVSPDFMASDYCYSIEMKKAMERHESGEARVIPIILRHVYWKRAPFGKLQALPTDAKPVMSHSWHSLDEAFFNVTEGILNAVEELAASRAASFHAKQSHSYSTTASTVIMTPIHTPDTTITISSERLAQEEHRSDAWQATISPPRQEEIPVEHTLQQISPIEHSLIQEVAGQHLENDRNAISNGKSGPSTYYLEITRCGGTPEEVKVAIDSTASWLDVNPQDHKVRNAYLALVLLKGTAEQAKVAIDSTASWLDVNPQDHKVRNKYLDLVRLKGTAEQLMIAYKLWEKYIDSNPAIDNISLMYSFGQILFKIEHYEECEKQLRNILLIKDTFIPARTSLAWCLYNTGRKQEALKELLFLKRISGKGQRYVLGAALHHLGHYYLLEGDFTKAISNLKNAISINPDLYGNYWELGKALLGQKKYILALNAFKEAELRLPINANEKTRTELKEIIEFAAYQSVENDTSKK